MASPDMGDAIAAIQRYSDDNVAIATAAEKARGDEALAVQAQTYEAALADLQARFDAYVAAHPDDEEPPPPPPPPPAVTRTVFGLTVSQPPPSGFATVDLTRAYLQPGEAPTSVTADSGVRKMVAQTRDVAWLSSKNADLAFARQLIPAILADGHVKRLLWTCRHEPENDNSGAGFDVAAYNREYADMRAIIDDLGYGDPTEQIVTLLPCLMNSQPFEANKRYMDGLVGIVDAIGFDVYNPGIQNPKAYAPVDQVYAKVLDFAAAYDLPLWIGETGTGPVGTDTAGQVTWARDAHRYLDGKVAGAAWWHAAKNLLTPALAQAFINGS